jgi:glyceraldehyde-3-phosphate dehydrogenase (NAD(P))
MNTVVPESTIPSHQAPDARTVDPKLDVTTMAVKVPETVGHVHFWTARLGRAANADDVLEALDASTRIVRVRMDDGVDAINVVKELALDLGRPRGDVYEVVLWEDLVTVEDGELYYAYMVDNQAIVIPETIDAIRALSGRESDEAASIRKTDRALGVRSGAWGKKPVTPRS